MIENRARGKKKREKQRERVRESERSANQHADTGWLIETRSRAIQFGEKEEKEEKRFT